MKKFNFFIIVITIILFGCGNETQKESKQSVEAHLKNMVNLYLSNMPPSEWVLEYIPENSLSDLTILLKEKREELLDAMNLWCPKTPLGMSIRTWVPSWAWAVKNGQDGETNNVTIVLSGKEGVITLVPKQNRKGVSFFCGKETNGKFVYIDALRMPRQLYAAFVLHEIGHADHYWRMKRSPSIAEEVEMHTLSADILDQYSAGEYKKYIQQIIKKNKGAKDFKQVCSYLSVTELLELDRIIISNTEIGKEVSSSVVVQHLLTICFSFIDEKQSGNIEEKVRAYNWVNSMAKPS